MDTFVKIHEYAVDSLSQHINNIYPHYSSHSITIEPEVNGKLPFLCLCVNVMDDGGTKITIYWKPTHTDQYLKFTSHHLLVHTRYVVRTNRAKLYVTIPDDQQAVIDHVYNALRANNCEEWAPNVPLSKPHKVEKTENNNTNSIRLMLGLTYVGLQGTSEILARIFKSHGVNMYHKPTNTMRSMLVHTKDKTPKERQCGTIYHITCTNDPKHTYVGESKQPLGVRFKENTKLDRPQEWANSSTLPQHRP